MRGSLAFRSLAAIARSVLFDSADVLAIVLAVVMAIVLIPAVAMADGGVPVHAALDATSATSAPTSGTTP